MCDDVDQGQHAPCAIDPETPEISAPPSTRTPPASVATTTETANATGHQRKISSDRRIHRVVHQLQILCEDAEIVDGPSRIRSRAPLRELIQGDPAVADVPAQAGDRLLSVTV